MLYRGGSQRNSVEYCQANTSLSLGWGGLADIGYPGQGQEFGSCSVQLKFKEAFGGMAERGLSDLQGFCIPARDFGLLIRRSNVF